MKFIVFAGLFATAALATPAEDAFAGTNSVVSQLDGPALPG